MRIVVAIVGAVIVVAAIAFVAMRSNDEPVASTERPAPSAGTPVATAPPAPLEAPTPQREAVPTAPNSTPAPSDASDAPARPLFDLLVTVVDDHHEPVAGAAVNSMPTNDREEWEEYRKGTTKGVSDKNGRVTLRVMAVDIWVAANSQRAIHAFNSGFVEHVTPGPSGVREVTITLVRCDASARVFVVDDLDRPVAGVAVNISATDREAVPTDANGIAQLVELQPGPARVSFDLRRSTAKDVCISDRDFSQVALPAGQETSIRLRVERPGAIELVASQPIDPGVVGEAMLSDRHSRYEFGNGRYRFAANGARIERVPPGRYQVFVELPADAAQNAESPIAVEVASGETKRVLIPIGRDTGVVAGHVFDESGLAVAGLTVVVNGRFAGRDIPAPNLKQAVTDATGAFRIRGVPNAPITLNVMTYGVRDRDLALFEPIEIPAPSEDVVLRVSRGYVIHGVVRRASGRDLDESCSVTIDHYWSKESDHRVNAERKGGSDEGPVEFEFRHLRPDTYVLRAAHPETDVEGPPVSVTVGPNVNPSDVLDVVLTIPAKKP